MRVRSKVWLEKDNKLVFGDGKSELLKAIDRTGSISKASRSMGISFRRGWSYVSAVEKRLGCRLIERSKGGRSGGGSYLTPLGKKLIGEFDKLNEAVCKFTDKKFKETFGGRSKYLKNK